MDKDGELVPMNERDYDSEALLQEYLARHHDLLAGDQIDGASPRRWLLVSREMSLASEEDGSKRWSVDHLFLDQDAVPTIVEVKRSTDTRIRREVVGQMLDYAANGVSYWDVGVLRERFETNAESEDALFDVLGDPDADPDEFWRNVERNLQAGRVRLVFVSDSIPPELRRIVEFLNEQMNPAEVIAVEIKQYVSDDSKSRTLIPRVIGQTTDAVRKKSSYGHRLNLDEDTFLQEIGTRYGQKAANTAGAALGWAKTNASAKDDIWWGKRQFTFVLKHKGHDHRPLVVSVNGNMRINLNKYRELELRDSETKAQEFQERLQSQAISAKLDKNIITVNLQDISNEDELQRLLKVFDWFVEEVRAT